LPKIHGHKHEHNYERDIEEYDAWLGLKSHESEDELYATIRKKFPKLGESAAKTLAHSLWNVVGPDIEEEKRKREEEEAKKHEGEFEPALPEYDELLPPESGELYQKKIPPKTYVMQKGRRGFISRSEEYTITEVKP